MDRDRLNELARRAALPERQEGMCVRAGVCELCGAKLQQYDSKWFRGDRMVCAEHWYRVAPPNQHWRHYTDG